MWYLFSSKLNLQGEYENPGFLAWRHVYLGLNQARWDMCSFASFPLPFPLVSPSGGEHLYFCCANGNGVKSQFEYVCMWFELSYVSHDAAHILSSSCLYCY